MLVLDTLAGLRFEKNPFGEVVDPGALLKLQSYCVDVTKLDAAEGVGAKTDSADAAARAKAPSRLLPRFVPRFAALCYYYATAGR
jgi:hypothetical protein